MPARRHSKNAFNIASLNALHDEFTQAIAADDPKAVAGMLEEYPDILNLFPSASAPLVEAVESGKYRAADALLAARPELLHTPTEGGFTPLTWIAIGPDQAAQVEYLVAKGADVNETDAEGDTPLHWTDPTNTEALLRCGAAVNLRDADGWTPLMCHAAEGHGRCGTHDGTEEQIEVLLAHGADLHATDPQGDNATMIAIRNQRMEVATWLIGIGGTIDPADPVVKAAVTEARDTGWDEFADAVEAYQAARKAPAPKAPKL